MRNTIIAYAALPAGNPGGAAQAKPAAARRHADGSLDLDHHRRRAARLRRMARRHMARRVSALARAALAQLRFPRLAGALQVATAARSA